MSNTLERRLARLECGATDPPGLFIHWIIDEQTQILECNGHRFTRQDGEGLAAFMERVTDSLPSAPGKVLWIEDAVA